MARWSGEQESKAFALASQQHGLITREQLQALGASDRTISRRVRAKLWQRRLPGVLRLLPSRLSIWHQELMAVCLWLGPEAAVSHEAAANLWELDGFPNRPVEVSVNRSHNGRTKGGIRVHRVRWVAKDNVTVHEGIPVTTVARTLIDVAATCAADEVDAGLDCALRRRLTTVKKFDHVILKVRQRGLRGLTAIRSLLQSQRGAKPKDSEQERWFYKHIIEPYGLPKPQHNFPIIGENGKEVARIDAAYPQFGLAIDLHSKLAHTSMKHRIHDSDRQNLLVRAGFFPLVFWRNDVVNDPEKVAREIWAAIGRVQATQFAG